MTGATELESRFSKLGGVFLTPIETLGARLKQIRGIVCDWDGVFNGGAKGDGSSSTVRRARLDGHRTCCAMRCGASTARRCPSRP